MKGRSVPYCSLRCWTCTRCACATGSTCAWAGTGGACTAYWRSCLSWMHHSMCNKMPGVTGKEWVNESSCSQASSCHWRMRMWHHESSRWRTNWNFSWRMSTSSRVTRPNVDAGSRRSCGRTRNSTSGCSARGCSWRGCCAPSCNSVQYKGNVKQRYKDSIYVQSNS